MFSTLNFSYAMNKHVLCWTSCTHVEPVSLAGYRSCGPPYLRTQCQTLIIFTAVVKTTIKIFYLNGYKTMYIYRLGKWGNMTLFSVCTHTKNI